MSVISLHELTLIKQTAQGKLLNSHQSEFPRELYKQLDLVIKQKRLGLNVQPLLKADPLLNHCLEQLESLLVGIFEPNRKLFIDSTLTNQLTQDYTISIHTNIGMVKGFPRLIEWGIRMPQLNWQDRVKLWVATRYFQVKPHKLKLTVLALHPHQEAAKYTHRWSSEQQKQTENYLRKLLSSQIKPSPPKAPVSKWNQLTNLEEIPEVPI